MNIKFNWLLVNFASVLALQVAFMFGSTVRADDYQCTGSVGGIQVDNLVVPDHATCTLNGTIVEGNIFVATNATLNAYEVQVNNDIQADEAARVNVYAGSSVGGNLQVFKSGAANIQSVDIDNNLLFNENNQSINAANNSVGGNLQAFKNTGGVSINDNTISGNLQCKENVPPPTGSGNFVSGNMEDQCANFGMASTPTPIPTNTPGSPTNTPSLPTQTPGIPTNTPVVDNQPPTVQWIGPVVAGEIHVVGEGEQIVLEAAAQDNESIKQVLFTRWDAVNLRYVTIGNLYQAPFRINVNARSLNPEWNQVFVQALDMAGNRSNLPFIWLYKLVDGEVSSLNFLPIIIK